MPITPFLTADVIAEKVQELGREITEAYSGEAVTVIPLLRGAMVFASDLIRELDLDVSVDFMRVRSYEGTEQTGNIQIVYDLSDPIEDQHVLIVEDIVDTGLTLHYIKQHLQVKHPKSLRVCTFLDKPSQRQVEVVPDFCGVTIENHFVVGYGLDYDQKYRNLPYVGVLSLD